ncbi:alpha/beta hydrolase [Rhodococcus chondri]|uniref:Alpha/beta hydrolase family protein n=1 Tax=Rhodococcus chondri TaxID=3065941 RepID=A0ABU7JTG6_9NOCA|nr:alpha/beta hydrolase family protein [Rhodococcus sp. CC-R104]MEE2033316.1 alpha/beta hydrolase family protein [Rhodococcus sp. CC-R104]
MPQRVFHSLAVSAVAVSMTVFGVTVANAEPAPAEAHVEHLEHITEQRWKIDVYSPSMDTVIPLDVLRPADSSMPRPVLYALGGAGVGVIEGTGWAESSDIFEFYSDKDVNVVVPATGNFSYYTDWANDDPVLGRNQWQTFLTEELPPVIDEALGANGTQSILGMSMSAGSALDLAIQSGDLYSGVASFSGCVRTSDPIGKQFVKLVVERRGKGDVENMWGPDGDPRWAEHDGYLNADLLRGKDIYLTSRNGLPGPYDVPGQERAAGESFTTQIIAGGAIEVATNICTRQLVDKLGVLGIPVTADLGAPGTHSWSYWEDDLRNSWPVLAVSMGLDA